MSSDAAAYAFLLAAMAIVAAWVVGAILGASCDSGTSTVGGILIVAGGLGAATWIAAVWRSGGSGRWVYVVPLSILIAAVPTVIAAFVSISAWFDNCFDLGVGF